MMVPQGLGEALEGNSLVQSDYVIKFAQNLPKTTVCSMLLDRQAEDMFNYAVLQFLVVCLCANTP